MFIASVAISERRVWKVCWGSFRNDWDYYGTIWLRCLFLELMNHSCLIQNETCTRARLSRDSFYRLRKKSHKWYNYQIFDNCMQQSIPNVVSFLDFSNQFSEQTIFHKPKFYVTCNNWVVILCATNAESRNIKVFSYALAWHSQFIVIHKVVCE